MSAFGTFETCHNVLDLVAIGRKADVTRTSHSVANDPKETIPIAALPVYALAFVD